MRDIADILGMDRLNMLFQGSECFTNHHLTMDVYNASIRAVAKSLRLPSDDLDYMLIAAFGSGSTTAKEAFENGSPGRYKYTYFAVKNNGGKGSKASIDVALVIFHAAWDFGNAMDEEKLAR